MSSFSRFSICFALLGLFVTSDLLGPLASDSVWFQLRWFGNVGYRWAASTGVIVLVLVPFAWAQPFLWQNRSRPVVPVAGLSVIHSSRIELLFANQPELKSEYPAAVDALGEAIGAENPARIGLARGEDDWEYPFWVLLKAEVRSRFRLSPEMGAANPGDYPRFLLMSGGHAATAQGGQPPVRFVFEGKHVSVAERGRVAGH